MKAGLIIVIVALMGAILAGSIGFTQTPYTDTSYDRVSDLTPIVSADPVLADEQYNPTTNQTGWQNVDYVTQTQPSVYSFRNPGTFGTFTTGTFASYGGISYTTSAAYSNGTYTPQGYTNITIGLTWSDNSNGAYLNSNQYAIGGYHDKSTVLTDNLGNEHYAECIVGWWNPWNLGGQVHYATDDTPIYWMSLTRMAIADHWASGVIVDGDTSAIRLAIETSPGNQGVDFWKSSEGDRLITNLRLNIHSGDGYKYYWNSETHKFYTITGYDDLTGSPIYDPAYPAVPVWLIEEGGSTSATLTLERYIPGSVTYVTPYSAVSIAPGNTATWSNGYTNSQVQLIVDRGASVNAAGVGIGISGSIPYEKVLLTLGGDGAYYQGLSDYVSPTSYTINPYKYVLRTAPLTPITELSVSGSSIAYVANTWVPLDPQGLLWQDPSFNINQYFPQITANGARVIFSSIITTGTSLTINGNTYNCSDKSIEIGDKVYRLNGLAVDYRTDGHVYIVPANGSEIDLGARTTYAISGSGVWYWSAELDSISVVTKERTDILTAQTPNPEWMVFAFIGISILCLVAMAAIGRESMDGMDWIVVILSIVISLMLVV